MPTISSQRVGDTRNAAPATPEVGFASGRPAGAPRFTPRPPAHAGAIRSQPAVRATPAAKPISLAQLKPKESTLSSRPAGAPPPSTTRDKRISAAEKIDVHDLRKTLEEALRERQKKSSGEETQKEEIKKEETKEKNVIKPGERVKF